jgi:hypothetical protein
VTGGGPRYAVAATDQDWGVSDCKRQTVSSEEHADDCDDSSRASSR